MEIGLNSDTASVAGGGTVTIAITWIINKVFGEYKSFRKATWKRIDQLDKEMGEHALLDVQTFATRQEVTAMRDHIDRKFTEQTNMIIGVIRESNGGRHV